MANDAAWQAGWDKGSRKSKNGDGGQKKGGVLSRVIPSLGSKMSNRKQAAKTPDSNAVSGEMQRGKFPSYKKGGRVRKTGLALLHKNEYVVPAKHRSTKKTSSKRTIVKV